MSKHDNSVILYAIPFPTEASLLDIVDPPSKAISLRGI